MFGGSSAPPVGFLWCNGTALSITSYPELYAAIGTTFTPGTVEAGNFCVPDMRGLVPIGAGAQPGVDVTVRALGAVAGGELTILSANNMPPHTHTGNTGDRSTSGIPSGYYNGPNRGYITGNSMVGELTSGTFHDSHSHGFTTSGCSDCASSPIRTTPPALGLNFVIKADEPSTASTTGSPTQTESPTSAQSASSAQTLSTTFTPSPTRSQSYSPQLANLPAAVSAPSVSEVWGIAVAASVMVVIFSAAAAAALAWWMNRPKVSVQQISDVPSSIPLLPGRSGGAARGQHGLRTGEAEIASVDTVRNVWGDYGTASAAEGASLGSGGVPRAERNRYADGLMAPLRGLHSMLDLDDPLDPKSHPEQDLEPAGHRL